MKYYRVVTKFRQLYMFYQGTIFKMYNTKYRHRSFVQNARMNLKN
jgi:hypothetical protein